jgi:predicted kinase
VAKAAVAKATPAAPKPVKAAKAATKATTKAAKAAAPAAPAATAPMTDAQLDARARKVEGLVGSARTSDQIHMTGGRWTAARAKQHQMIVDELWKAASGVPTDKKSIMLGGMAGAGKGTVLAQHPNADQYLVLDPDLAKEALARHGLIPDVPGHPDLSPLERAGLVHAESIHILEMLAQRAYANGTNVMWDATMGIQSSVQRRIADLRAHGYGVEGLFVNVPFNVGERRVRERYRQGQRDYMAGKGQGGRIIPGWALQGFHTGNQGTTSAATFRAIRSSFDSWELWDNSMATPVLSRKG